VDRFAVGPLPKATPPWVVSVLELMLESGREDSVVVKVIFASLWCSFFIKVALLSGEVTTWVLGPQLDTAGSGCVDAGGDDRAGVSGETANSTDSAAA